MFEIGKRMTRKECSGLINNWGTKQKDAFSCNNYLTKGIMALGKMKYLNI